MSKILLDASLVGNMAFEMEMNGHKVITDASPDIGGENRGPRPKALMLTSLIGCTGIDVRMILNKMKVELKDMKISVEAELTEGEPSVFSSIHLIYTFLGKDLPIDKLERAVSLSMEKYCGVSAMLEKVAPISYEIIIPED